MSYIPKINVVISHANAGIFMHRYTKKPYEGFYMETAEGKYFAGKNPPSIFANQGHGVVRSIT